MPDPDARAAASWAPHHHAPASPPPRRRGRRATGPAAAPVRPPVREMTTSAGPAADVETDWRTRVSASSPAMQLGDALVAALRYNKIIRAERRARIDGHAYVSRMQSFPSG
ncbi:hypothetical protein ABZP36_021618 [Zizania latifolia]